MTAVDTDPLAVSVGNEAPIVAHVIGSFEIRVGGRPIDRSAWQRVSAERLVKLLLVTEGHVVGREQAVEILWPETNPDAGRAQLRKALHCARHALGVSGALVADGNLIRLDPSLVAVDLDLLRVALDEPTRVLDRGTPRPIGRDRASEDPGPSPSTLAPDAVLELGARPLLPDDAFEDWLVLPREQLQSRWQVAAMTAARTAAAADRPAEAHAILERLLEHDPTDEAAHRLVIGLYASEGRHHAARRQFELCRRALAAILDAEPSPETVAAYRAAEVTATTTVSRSAPLARLVARRRELGRVEALLDHVASGHSGTLVIRGRAGIGKTRLLDEVRELCRSAGWRELSWQAIESSKRFAFAPITLRLGSLITSVDFESWEEPERSAVARILPGLGVTPHLEFADRSAFVLALVAALARVARDHPLLIAIDDVPWLDEASTEVLGAAASAFRDVPILLVLTQREDEGVPDHVAALLEGLRRSGALTVELGPLAERDIEHVVLAHLGGQSIAPDLATWLFERSAGNPLFCLEMVRDAAERGAIRLDNENWHAVGGALPREAPRAVRELVASRVRSLPPAATRLLGAAAELGPIVEYETLAAVLPDVEGGVLAALDAALSSGLLIERRGGYAFAHPLFRLALASRSAAGRRAELHLALARALAGTTTDGDQDPVILANACADPGPVADHALTAYELGLHEAGPLAVAFGFAAGLRARRLFDRAAGASFLERALPIWRGLPTPSAARFDAATAFVGLAELRMLADDEAAAEADFRAALDAARSATELAEAYEHFSWLRYRHGDFAGTIALCEEALARIPQDAVGARAIIDVRIGFCLGRLHRLPESVERLERAVVVLDSAGDQVQLAQALDHLGPFLAFSGRTVEAFRALDRSLAISLDLHDGRLEGMVRTHFAGLLPRAGRAEEARSHARRGIELAEQMGDWYMASVGAWLSAEAEDAVGDCSAAVQLRKRELAWLTQIGGNAHNEALAHAHLANLARRAGDERTWTDEAKRARAAAAADPDPGYAARIERALTAERWADVQEF